MKKLQPSEVKKILVVNFGGIGDVLLSTPALRALKKTYPRAKLNLLVARRVESLARTLTYVDRVFGLEVTHPWIYGGYNLLTLLSLRKENIDLAVNMRTIVSLKSALKLYLVLALIRPEIKAGRNTAGRGIFFDLVIPEEDIGSRCELDYNIALAEALGAQVTDRSIDFSVKQESREALKKLLLQAGIKDSDIIVGIHPGGRPSRRWPADNFILLMQKIRRQTDCFFVITGASDERSLADKIIKQSQVAAINLAGKLDIETLGALLMRCNLYISNDTGPMHIAAMLKTPLVAILGPGCFNQYNPQSLSCDAVVLYKPTDCSPCNKFRCRSLACLRNITVGEAVAAVFKFLKPKSG
jgi:heptosyltransferase-2